MQLVVLGSGTSVPHPARAASGYWLDVDNDDSKLLLDVSSDTPHRLAQEKLDWPNLDAIWISHYHWDHMAGLIALLFGMKWAPQTMNRTKRLRIYGGPGLRQVLEGINKANNFQLIGQSFPVEINEVTSGEEFQLVAGLTAKVLSTPHTSESLAIRLTSEDRKSLVYTSDTGFCEELISFAKRATVLLMECSFRKNKPVQTHLELSDAMNIAAGAAPDTLVLTHLYPEWDEVDLEAEARALWQGKTIQATDGLRLVI
jgi:ribonuclease BN (tRNA processing enzyme)